MQFTVQFSDDTSQRLIQKASELSLQPEEFICVSVTELLDERNDEFRRIVDRIVSKNRELYERLS